MHANFRPVTLLQLLTHRAGLPDDREDGTTQSRIDAAGGTLTEKRLAMVRTRTSVAPTTAPGSAYQYSNAGYEIAAALAERVTGQTYEDLMQVRVFEPLGMNSAGFGAPGTSSAVNTPRGHTTVLNAAVAVPPGPAADNPLFTAPSGGIHCSLADWARFAAAHLAGARGENDWLSPEAWNTLHTPPAGEYACGWMVLQDTPLGRALFHDGGNTMWYAVIYLLPDSNTAVLVATNRGDEQHAERVVEFINTLAAEVAAAGD
jgi:CubicO group peptidase (beta-lactamase class C family)